MRPSPASIIIIKTQWLMRPYGTVSVSLSTMVDESAKILRPQSSGDYWAEISKRES